MKVFLSSLLLIISTAAFSQPDSHPYFFGGASIPSEPTEFNEYWNVGFIGGVGYLINHSERLDLGGEIFYSRNGFKGEKFLEYFVGSSSDWDISGGGANIIAANGFVNFKFNNQFNVSGGGGLYNFSFSKFEATYKMGGYSSKVESNPDSKTKFGLNAGVNISFGKLGVRGKIHNIFTEEESTRLFDIGLTYSLE